MLGRAAFLALVIGGAAFPADATEWINCSDAGGAAHFDILVGFTDVLSISAVTAGAGDKEWSSGEVYGPGAPIQIGQAYEDAETIRVVAVDADYERLVELNVFKSVEGDGDPALGGTLRIVGLGAWPVSCVGP